MLGYMSVRQSNGGRNRRNSYAFDLTKMVDVVDSIDEEKRSTASTTNGRPDRPQMVDGVDTHTTLELNTGTNTGNTKGADAPSREPIIIEPIKKGRGLQGSTEITLPCLASSSASPDAIADMAFQAFALVAENKGIAVPMKCDRQRREKIKCLIKEHGVEGWQMAMEAIETSKFLQGVNDRAWKLPGIDWLLQPHNFTKVIEGNYRDVKRMSRLEMDLYDLHQRHADGVESDLMRDIRMDIEAATAEPAPTPTPPPTPPRREQKPTDLFVQDEDGSG
jgi:hypothetical protein